MNEPSVFNIIPFMISNMQEEIENRQLKIENQFVILLNFIQIECANNLIHNNDELEKWEISCHA